MLNLVTSRHGMNVDVNFKKKEERVISLFSFSTLLRNDGKDSRSSQSSYKERFDLRSHLGPDDAKEARRGKDDPKENNEKWKVI